MDFASPKTAQTNGITMEYFEQGEGTPVLLLHGFPEHAYSWRHQVDPVAAAGFRVIVPNQRGYAGTDATPDPDDYSVKNVVADITGLLDALAIEQAVWFGHDWGSMPAWYSGVYAPDRVLGVGSLCTPYFTPGEGDLVEIYDELRGPKHYMRTFQEPGVGEALLERDVEHTFRALLRGRGYTLEEFKQAPKEIQELPAGWFVGDPQLFGAEILTEEELGFYVDTYKRTGFTGGLNWYRAIHKNWQEALGYEFVIDKPALMVAAADDWALPVDFTGGMDQLLPQLEMHVIPDAAHWLQQEKPAEVNALLVPWLLKNFAH
ncbi:MAG: alpha/beta fold hydrolase [Solirubrobacteraceae bacterium]